MLENSLLKSYCIKYFSLKKKIDKNSNFSILLKEIKQVILIFPCLY